MTCFTPLQGFRSKFLTRNGKRKLVFNPKEANGTSPEFRMSAPCGQCAGCRLEYSRQWAVRCMHEAQVSSDSCFVTLTYNNKFLPANSSLDYRHFTLFMKRLRKKFGIRIRYYMGPEYGEKEGRPHYHILVFGMDFPDKVLWTIRNEHRLYRSAILESLWSDPKTGESYGFASVGSVTFESAAYVARYIMKKVKGEDLVGRYFSRPDANGELVPIEPEKARMSRRPGIAKEWFDQYSSDVYPGDFVMLNGRKLRPPRYYDTLLQRIDPSAIDAIKSSREILAKDFSANCTPDRLAVRKVCLEAKLKFLPRNINVE